MDKKNLGLMLYFSTSAWVLSTPNTGGNHHFNIFVLKSLKKVRHLKQNLAKTSFLSLHQKAVQVFNFEPLCNFATNSKIMKKIFI